MPPDEGLSAPVEELAISQAVVEEVAQIVEEAPAATDEVVPSEEVLTIIETLSEQVDEGEIVAESSSAMQPPMPIDEPPVPLEDVPGVVEEVCTNVEGSSPSDEQKAVAVDESSTSHPRSTEPPVLEPEVIEEESAAIDVAPLTVEKAPADEALATFEEEPTVVKEAISASETDTTPLQEPSAILEGTPEIAQTSVTIVEDVPANEESGAVVGNQVVLEETTTPFQEPSTPTEEEVLTNEGVSVAPEVPKIYEVVTSDDTEPPIHVEATSGLVQESTAAVEETFIDEPVIDDLPVIEDAPSALANEHLIVESEHKEPDIPKDTVVDSTEVPAGETGDIVPEVALPTADTDTYGRLRDEEVVDPEPFVAVVSTSDPVYSSATGEPAISNETDESVPPSANEALLEPDITDVNRDKDNVESATDETGTS